MGRIPIEHLDRKTLTNRLSEHYFNFGHFFKRFPWVSPDSFVQSSAAWIATSKEPKVFKYKYLTYSITFLS